MHNYVLDCKQQDEDKDSLEDEPEIHAMPGSPLGWGYLPTIENFHSFPGISHTQDTVLHKMTREVLWHPVYNLERRALE